MTVSLSLINTPKRTSKPIFHLPGRRSRTPTRTLHHQLLLLLLLLIQHNNNNTSTSFLPRPLRPLQRPRSLQSPLGYDRSQHGHPQLGSLELGLRERGFPLHAAGILTTTRGREPDRVECEAIVEFDVFGGEEEFGIGGKVRR
jgi:hypothetical protein